jgi:hypothetical protein
MKYYHVTQSGNIQQTRKPVTRSDIYLIKNASTPELAQELWRDYVALKLEGLVW